MENYQELINKQQTFFRTGITKDTNFRIEALTKLKDLIQDRSKR